MAKTSPTQRTLAYCRKQGWDPAVVEKRVPYKNITQDLYGFADLLVVRPETPGLLAIQATSGPNLSTRMDKLSGLPMVAKWLSAGLAVECWGWRKLLVKRGGKAVRWTLRRVVGSLVNGLVTWTEAGEQEPSTAVLIDSLGGTVGGEE